MAASELHATLTNENRKQDALTATDLFFFFVVSPPATKERETPVSLRTLNYCLLFCTFWAADMRENWCSLWYQGLPGTNTGLT